MIVRERKQRDAFGRFIHGHTPVVEKDLVSGKFIKKKTMVAPLVSETTPTPPQPAVVEPVPTPPPKPATVVSSVVTPSELIKIHGEIDMLLKKKAWRNHQDDR